MFELTTEHDELRKAVRAFLAETSPESETRRLMETEAGYDREVWERLAVELGLTGLGIPAELGGSGAGAVEVGIVMEEMGRALVCSPYLSTAVMSVAALLPAEDAFAKEHLFDIAAGTTVATLAVAETSGNWDPEEITTTATERDGCWTIDGEKLFVLDGLIADLLIVAARTSSGLRLFAVAADARGLTRDPMTTLDPTRKLARIRLSRVLARPLTLDASAVLSDVLDRALVSLGAEQVGGAQRCVEMAVAYACEREQFGRPIGSFQAIKHRCADMLVGVEGARTAAYYGLWTAAGSPADLPVAAGIAAVTCSDAYVYASNENVQVHGGMGFTWEHPAHLYVRRARSSQLLFGDPSRHRERLATTLGV